MNLERIFDDIGARLEAIQNRLRGVPQFRWGVVTGVSPLSITLDTEADPLLGKPATLVQGLAVGDRVLLLLHNRRHTVIGTGRGEWEPVPLATGIAVHSGYTPRMSRRDGRFVLEGAAARSSGSFGTSYLQVVPPNGIPDLPGLRDPWRSVRLYPSAGNAPALRGFIDTDGSLSVATTTGTASYVTLNASFEIGD